jgi:holo-[acyl-carrier protein] synthase
MIIGIGIDTVEIERFFHWAKLSPKSLQRVLSQKEIEYCLLKGTQSAASFAARFAAKEAFLKALSTTYNGHLQLLTLAKTVELEKKENGAPSLVVDWPAVRAHYASLEMPNTVTAHVSISHTRSIATAIVLLETIQDRLN